MNLSKKQKEVIKCVQDGWIIITDCQLKGAIIARAKGEQFHINAGVFWRLVEKDMIFQQQQHPFNYILTEKGEKIIL